VIGPGYNTKHELYSIAEKAYIEEHLKRAKELGKGEYLPGYNYKKVIDEFAESVRA